MKSVRLLFVAFAMLYLTGCPHEVNLTVKNPTSMALATQVTVKSSAGVPVQQIDLGTLQPNGNASQTFKADDDNQYVVTADIPTSANVFSQTKTVTSSDPKQIEASVTLAIQGGAMLNPTDSAETIQSSFQNMGPYIGFKPVPIIPALQTLFGGLLVIAQQQSGANPTFQVVFQLTPNQFGSLVITPQNFQWPTTNTSNTINWDSEVTAKVGANVPLFSSVAANFDQSSVYNVQWQLVGYGMSPKPEADGWNYQTAFAGLKDSLKDQLCTALQNDGAFVIYVNEFYVLQNATFTVKQARKVDLGGSLNGGVVNLSGGWSFTDSTSTSQIFQNSVLNIDGVRWQKGGISCTAAPAHPNIAIEQLGAYVVKVGEPDKEPFHLTTDIITQVQSRAQPQ